MTVYRSEYSRDLARVLHSPSFRRLQNKTQLFPGQESDFFRNRLTHSLEVSQIATSIAKKIKTEYPDLDLIPRVCEIAGLLHDIGHPPFGHNGEAALDECMAHFGGFEGNAQTIRIITRLEKKECPDFIVDKHGYDCRVGLNLTARVIASVLKYDNEIPVVREPPAPLVKGYYHSEHSIIDKVKECLVENPNELSCPFKTIECSIMDIADDIAYSTYDVEDAFKAGFLTPYDMLSADASIYQQIANKLKKDDIMLHGKSVSAEDCRSIVALVLASVWSEPLRIQKSLSEIESSDEFEKETMANFLKSYITSKNLASNGYLRTKLTSKMVNTFINGVRVNINHKYPILSNVYLDDDTLLKVNVLKHFTFVSQISSSRLKVAERRGHQIVRKMFDEIKKDNGYVLLPEDTRELYAMVDDELWRSRVICDFIAGMTDRYAVEFYGRLFSENPQSIFKPLY